MCPPLPRARRPRPPVPLLPPIPAPGDAPRPLPQTDHATASPCSPSSRHWWTPAACCSKRTRPPRDRPRANALLDYALDVLRQRWQASAERQRLPHDPVLLERIVTVSSLAVADGETD